MARLVLLSWAARVMTIWIALVAWLLVGALAALFVHGASHDESPSR